MENAKVKMWKKVIPSLLLFAVIALMVGLSFLPSVRGASVAPNPTADSGVDAEAVRVLNECRAYAAARDYEAQLTGTIKAKVFGIPYSQNVRGSRSVRGADFEDTFESVSAFVKAGFKKQCSNGEYRVFRGNYKKKKFSYGDAAPMARDKYIEAYGMPATDIVKYELDNSIVSAKRTADNTYVFVLDASRATRYSRNEVKTILGGKSYPSYESVELTLVTDGGRAIEVRAVERFRVDKFGGTHCSATYVYTFSYHGAE